MEEQFQQKLLTTIPDEYSRELQKLKKKLNEKDREGQTQRLLQKKRLRDKDKRLQDLAVLKQISRTAESYEKRAARLKLQEIFIPQWPELAIID